MAAYSTRYASGGRVTDHRPNAFGLFHWFGFFGCVARLGWHPKTRWPLRTQQVINWSDAHGFPFLPVAPPAGISQQDGLRTRAESG